MSFIPDLRRRGVHLLAPLVAAAALLAACGGGTSQGQIFQPARLLVLGDDNGALVDDGTRDGFKYNLNDRTGSAAGKCKLLPTPPQQVAAEFGLVFSACNPDGVAPNAFALAQPGAQVDGGAGGLQAQVDGIDGLGASDLVMVMVGTNDVIALYEQRRDGSLASDAQALAEADRRGKAAAVQINRLLSSGARGLVFTVPVLGKSPYAITADKARPGAAALITALAARFNAALRLGIDSSAFDGRHYGLVLADDVTAAMERFPSSYLSSPANKTDALCPTAALPQGCLVVADTDNVAPDNSVRANTHLWVSDRFVGPVANVQIGAQALSRARNNPF